MRLRYVWVTWAYHQTVTKGYQYPHHFDQAWVNQQYLPDKLKNAQYYQPKDTGKYEQALGQQYYRIKEWKKHPPKN